ncbi:TPA: hypothetical protein N0F65_007617 [Lagenidium giganteum]|uniref:Uncharacterized protein n=1 Tax=Lagenidium giganteum TaxID=4803 RepID=A0AAV2Z975_9STRA|nr:TPA: hypothetical protein N0F65_007617 [Lagenidium giganteum]
MDMTTAVEPRKCTFTLTIDVLLDDNEFHSPGFRCRFLDGTKKVTTAVGTPGWTPLADSSDTNNAVVAASARTMAATPGQTIQRYEFSYPDILVTEAMALAMDDDPVLSVFFFDSPALVQPQAKDPKAAKGAHPNAAAAAAQVTTENANKAYLGLFELDVSSMLGGRQHVEQTWQHAAQEQLTLTDQEDQPLSPEDALLPPHFLNKKRGTDAQEAISQSIFPAPKGIRQLTIALKVDQTLFSPAMARKLNPLTITLTAARRLPGTNHREAPHQPLQQHCKPVYILFHFFSDRLRPTAMAGAVPLHTVPRMFVSTGLKQASTVKFQQDTTFLMARYNATELLDTLANAPLSMELHDRDLKQDEQIDRLKLKWETLHTTGVDITIKNTTTPRGQHESTAGIVTSARSTTPRTANSHQSAAATAAANKGLDVYVVDETARKDWRLLLTRAKEHYPFGVVSLRLAELLNDAKLIFGRNSLTQDAKPFMDVKFSADITASKRRARPVGSAVGGQDGDELSAAVDLSPTEKLIREPGSYAASGTVLALRVALQHPIEVALNIQQALGTPVKPGALSPVAPPGKFCRLVLIIPYKDHVALSAVMDVMAHVNLSTLPNVPIRSYQMTEREKAECDNGTLDLITGIQVIDSQFRMIVLEGLAEYGMKLVHTRLERRGRNDAQGYRMFANDHIRFTQRLYTAFEIDLKRIKLRHPLYMLMNTPDIYMRAKVSANCYNALVRLTDLRKADRLVEVKELDLFPTAEMLLEVESKYGESITLEDIYGQHFPVRKSPKKINGATSVKNQDMQDLELALGDESSAGTATRASRKTFKAATDSTNASYERLRKERTEKNFIDERRQVSETVQAEYEERKKIEEEEIKRSGQGPVYMYSGQKLRTHEALQEEMRKRLARDVRGTYTYSADFQSLAVSSVNPEALLQAEEEESRKKWTTKRGFVYPAPAKPEDYAKHPDAPSEARREDLRQPFVDNVNRPKPVSRDSNDEQLLGKPVFSTIPAKDVIFGGTNGDGSANKEYFRSVHLCGEGLRLEMEEARRLEQERWEERLVVDKKQIKFLAHGNICSLPRLKPSQLDKTKDILNGAAQSKPIRIVRNAKLPSGKRVPLEALPPTIHNQQEYTGPIAQTFALTLRPTDETHFVARDSETGEPRDFAFPAVTNILVPVVKRATTHTEIKPMRPSEKQGAIWSNVLEDTNIDA